MGGLYKEDLDLMGEYTECATRNDKLINTINAYLQAKKR